MSRLTDPGPQVTINDGAVSAAVIGVPGTSTALPVGPVGGRLRRKEGDGRE